MTVIPIRDGDRAEPEPGSDSDTARSQTAEPLPDPDEIPAAPRADIPKRQQIVPEHLTRAQLPITLREWAGKTWYQARFHGFRSPAHLVMFIWYALRGAGKLTKRLFTWWHWTHGWIMESAGVAAGRSGTPEAMRVHVEGKKTRAARGKIVAACAVSFIVLLVAAIHYLAWVAWAMLLLAGFPVFVYHGRPEGKPLVSPAILPPAYTVPTPEIITRGLGSLGIEKINQAIKGGGLDWVSDVHRDGEGWGVEVDLPHGVTAKMIIKRREELSSGLRRPLSATWPEPVPEVHDGRLYLWIGRHDLSKARRFAYPLLRAGQADIFAGVPFATNPRGVNKNGPMFQANWLIGAQPGNGKTAAVRVLLAAAALDPICDLWTHEFSGKGDLEPYALVSHRYVSGLDQDALAYGADSISLLRDELERRQAIFKRIPGTQKIDGALTRELAMADRRLRPIVVTFDEVQNLFLDPLLGPQAAADLAYVMRLGRAYGIIVILATQRPDKDSMPTAIGGLVQARFCMKVGDQVSNDMVLGTGAYKAGFNAVAFRHEIDAGLGWLRGTADPEALRTYYLNLKATARICARARALRRAEGVLSGHALGEADDEQSARSFAADVLSVFGTDPKLWSETIAARLRDSIPGVYATITPEAVASQLRDLGVTVKDVRETGKGPRKGCERAAVEDVAGAREAVNA